MNSLSVNVFTLFSVLSSGFAGYKILVLVFPPALKYVIGMSSGMYSF